MDKQMDKQTKHNRRYGLLLFILILSTMAVLLMGLSSCGSAGRHENKLIDDLAGRIIETPVQDMGADEDPVTIGIIDVLGNFTGDTFEIATVKDRVYKKTIGDFGLYDYALPLSEKDPGQKERYPFILFIPGGSWTDVKKENLTLPAEGLSYFGFATAVINTRVLPNYGYFDQLEDVLDALQYFYDNADLLQINRDEIFVVGVSSGGNMALTAAYSRGNIPERPKWAGKYTFDIAGVSTMSAPIDMNELRLAKSNMGVGLSTDLFPDITVNRAGLELASKIMNPISYITEETPTTLIIGGSNDSIVPSTQARILHKALSKHGIESKLLIYLDATHTEWSEGEVFKAMGEFFQNERIQKEQEKGSTIS